eukprot:896621-Pleurochrysis_carterae.AAC.1
MHAHAHVRARTFALAHILSYARARARADADADANQHSPRIPLPRFAQTAKMLKHLHMHVQQQPSQLTQVHKRLNAAPRASIC